MPQTVILLLRAVFLEIQAVILKLKTGSHPMLQAVILVLQSVINKLQAVILS